MLRATRRGSVLRFALASLLASGCGGEVEASGAALGDAAVEPDVSDDGEAEAGREAAPVVAPFGPGGCDSPCPSELPRAGSPCTVAGLECEYGGAFDARCNTIARCESTRTWTVLAPRGACPSAEELEGVECPSSPFGPERGKPCPVEGAVCTYVDGVCGCQPAAGDAGAEHVWACAVFTCKGPRARLGCSCSGATSCQHGGCGGELASGIDLVCRDGFWRRPDLCR